MKVRAVLLCGFLSGIAILFQADIANGGAINFSITDGDTDDIGEFDLFDLDPGLYDDATVDDLSNYVDEEFDIFIDYEDTGIQLNLGRGGLTFSSMVLNGLRNNTAATIPLTFGNRDIISSTNHGFFTWNTAPTSNLIALDVLREFATPFNTPQDKEVRTTRLKLHLSLPANSLDGFTPTKLSLVGNWDAGNIGNDKFRFQFIRSQGTAAVPEPNSIMIWTLGLIGMSLRRTKRGP